MRCIKWVLSVLLAACLALSIGIPAYASGRNRTVVRVGFPIQAGISYLDENGNYAGYLVDYLERLRLYTGWRFEYVRVDGDLNTQLSTLLDMLETGEIDMMGTMNRSDELEQLYLYSDESYGITYTTLAVAIDSEKWIEGDFSNWDGITVASYPGFEQRMELLRQYAAVNGFTFHEVQYGTHSEAYNAVLNGRADATIQVDISMPASLRSIARFSPTPYYFALYKGNGALLERLNEALSSIKRAYPHLQDELYERYFSATDRFYISEESKKTIRSLGTVNVLFFAGNAPFQYIIDGELQGFAPSYFEKFSQLTGLTYQPMVATSYQDGIALLKSGQVDIVACIPTNSGLISDFDLRLTEPYFSSNNVLVSNASYVWEGYNHNMDVCPDAERTLNRLRAGEQVCVRMDSHSINYYMRKKALYDNLRVDWTDVHSFSYAVATRSQMPEELLDILNLYSSTLGDATRQNMLYDSFADPVDYSLPELFYIYRTTIAGVMVVVLLLLCVYLLRRKSKRDQLQMRANERRIHHLSRYDELTGAYNGAYFRKQLEELCREKVPLALVALNIRNFRYINETYGVSTADAFLCRVKEILDGALGEGEFFCRQGADVFYLAFQSDTPANITQRIEKIYDGIQRKSRQILEEYPVLLYSGCVLTAESPEPYSITNLSYMMAALAQARKKKLDICFYDQTLHASEQLRHYVESHMQSALEQEEFQLYLQPKMNLHTGQLEGAEALVRWQPQDRGMLYPNQFIPLFEENGFCAQLDLYMVDQACKQQRVWKDQGLPLLPISINQIKPLFYSEGYVDKLLAITRKYDISPRYLTLEILEGLALENVDKFNRSIEQLNAVGFRISMDDFGSGYSSLNTLGKLKIDELKLDRLFLLDVAKDPEGKQRKVLASIVSLAKELKIHTVVEGVETKENEQMMIELSCDCGQGYYYSKPISTAQFREDFLLPAAGGC